LKRICETAKRRKKAVLRNQSRIRMILKGSVHGRLGPGSGSISYPNEHNKLTRRENLTKYALWLNHVGPTEKDKQVKMFEVHYLFETVRIRNRIRIKQPDPAQYQIEKQDPDWYQGEPGSESGSVQKGYGTAKLQEGRQNERKLK
jgi:hypothetical protein